MKHRQRPVIKQRGFGFAAYDGSYVVVSIVARDISFSDPKFHKRGTMLLGGRNATIGDFERMMAAMRAGEIPIALITHRLRLSDMPQALAGLTDPPAGVHQSASRGCLSPQLAANSCQR